MPGLSRPAQALEALLIATLLLTACSKEEAPPAAPAPDAARRKEAGKTDAKPGDKAAATNAPVEVTGPLPPVTAPKPIQLRDGAPTVFAQFTAGVAVPMATRRANTWVVEEVQTLDRMTEGSSGKDAAPEVLVNWWKQLDVIEGDTFLLRGDQGAEGTLKVKHEFATADRGGCIGLVWSLPGEVKWTVKPKGATSGTGEDGAVEHVWALRGTFEPRSSKVSRELTKEELTAGRQTLAKVQETLTKMAPPLPDGATWQACDSLSDNPCKAARARLMVMDLEGDGQPEAMTTIQLRPTTPDGKSVGGANPVEARVLLGFTPQGVRILGRWDGDAKRSGEEGQAPIFSGVIDVTGDGRAELVFRRLANETENWEVFQADPQKPGQWTSLFKTQNEGC